MKSYLFKRICLGMLIVIFTAGGWLQPVEANTDTPTATPAVLSQEEEPDKVWPSMMPAVAAGTAATTDQFGYTSSETTYTWKDIIGSTVVFTDTDNEFKGPYPLDFSFPFYENTYDEVYVNANGMLSFIQGTTNRTNIAIPQEPAPNNFIAPLWANIVLGPSYDNPEGIVYYDTGQDAKGKFCIFEWYRVDSLTEESNESILTFEVILYEDGDIVFQYETLTNLPSKLTIGIEDIDGIDGLMYLHNSSLTTPIAILFERPNTSSRVKVLPALQGGFTENGLASFQISVHNTGDDPAHPEDTFNLSASSTGTGWSASFWSEDGSTPLSDSDSNEQPDTGSLTQGAAMTITVKAQALPTSSTSLSSKITVTAQSKNSSSQTTTSSLQVAIPAAFAQAYSDNSLHFRLLDRNSQGNLIDVDSSFGGSNMSLSTLLGKAYAFTWEINFSKEVGTQFILYTNTGYALYDSIGRTIYPTTMLTDNSEVTLSTRDRSPMMAAASDGTIGTIWYQTIYDHEKEATNENILFSRLNASGSPIANSQTNVTQNTGWRESGTLNVPFFFSPRILATKDNRFVLSWADERLTADGLTRDIWYAIYEANGDLATSPTKLTTSIPDELTYSEPALTLLSGNRIFLSYTHLDEENGQETIVFTVLNSSGEIQQAETGLADVEGNLSDAIQLSNGRILLAWTNVSTSEIAYAILDGDSYAIIHTPTILSNPEPIPRPADFVSVTFDRKGYGIITWMDARWHRHLYYALVDIDGNLLVDPMIFLTSNSTDVFMQTSFTGYGNAPRAVLIYLPLIAR